MVRSRWPGKCMTSCSLMHNGAKMKVSTNITFINYCNLSNNLRPGGVTVVSVKTTGDPLEGLASTVQV